MKMKRTVFVAIALVGTVVLLTESLSQARDVRGVTDDTIKIGMILDMTGPAAGLEVVYANAQRDYFRWVNEQGGIHGRKISLLVEDDRYSIPAAFAAFKKLAYKDRVLCISGPGGTGQHTAMFSQLQKTKMPSFAITISPIMHTPYKRYVFPPAGDFWDFIGVTYDYIVNKMGVKAPKIAMVRPDTEGGKVCATGAKKWADFYNQKYYEEYMAVGAMDITPQVLKLKKNGIDNIIVAGNTTGAAALVLRTCKRFRYSPNVHGVHYACGDEVIESVPDAAENYYGIHAYSKWHEDTPEMNKLRKLFVQYHPDSKPPIIMYQQGWYWGKIISEGLARAGRDVDGEKLVDALETFKDFDTGGLCGPVTYTSKSHKATNYCKMFKADMKKKRLVAITDWMKPAE
ncbi:MAG: ABC transporter substrate-binding protein [Pseudomonadota bacterium]